MYKDGIDINIDLLNSEPSTEANGVKVQVDINRIDLSKYIDEIESQLSFFPNVYINTVGLEGTSIASKASEINNSKIISHKTFKILDTDTSNSISILIGPVKYPLDKSQVDIKDLHIFLYAFNSPLAITCEIGKVKVTPNREQVIYTPETIKYLNEKIREANEEVLEIVSKQVQEIDTFQKFVDFSNKNNNCLDMSFGGNFRNAVPYSSFFLDSFKYCGVESNERNLSESVSYSFKPFLRNGTKVRRDNQAYTFRYFISNKEKFAFGNTGSMKGITTTYLKEFFGYDTINFIDKKEIYSLYLSKRMLKMFGKEFTKEFYKYIEDIPYYDDESVPESWKLERKEEEKRRKEENKVKKEFTFYEFNKRNSPWNSTTTMQEFDCTKNHKKLIIYGNQIDKENLRIISYSFKKYKNIKVGWIAKNKNEKMKNVKGAVHIDDFLTRNSRPLQRLATAIHLSEVIDNTSPIKGLNCISKSFDKSHNKIIKYINTYSSSPNTLTKYILNLFKENDGFDKDIMAEYNKSIAWYNNMDVINLTLDNYNEVDPKKLPLVLDYMITKKLVRPDCDCVLYYRNKKKENVNY